MSAGVLSCRHQRSLPYRVSTERFNLVGGRATVLPRCQLSPQVMSAGVLSRHGLPPYCRPFRPVRVVVAGSCSSYLTPRQPPCDRQRELRLAPPAIIPFGTMLLQLLI